MTRAEPSSLMRGAIVLSTVTQPLPMFEMILYALVTIYLFGLDEPEEIN